MSDAAPQINQPESAVKRELDRLELVECVPALRREACQCAKAIVGRMFAYAHDRDADDYELVFQMPRHPAIARYAHEQVNVHRESSRDLKVARRRFKAAYLNYEKRCSYRARRDICLTPEEELVGRYAPFAKFISLSAIIEAKAEAMHWFKIVMNLEYVAHVGKQNRWNVARSRVSPL
jgi:hypothetical protein